MAKKTKTSGEWNKETFLTSSEEKEHKDLCKLQEKGSIDQDDQDRLNELHNLSVTRADEERENENQN